MGPQEVTAKGPGQGGTEPSPPTLSVTAQSFIALLSQDSLYPAREALRERAADFAGLANVPEVQAAAVSAVLKGLKQGDILDTTRFTKEFGVNAELLQQAGAPEVVLTFAGRHHDAALISDLLATFRPQAGGAYDREFFERAAPLLCTDLTQGSGFALIEAIDNLRHPGEVSAYSQHLPQAVLTLADQAGITDMKRLAMLMTQEKSGGAWTRLFLSLAEAPDARVRIAPEDRTLPLSVLQSATLRMLDVEPASFAQRLESGERTAATWQPSYSTTLNRAEESFSVPENCSTGFAKFISVERDPRDIAIIELVFERHDFRFPGALYSGDLKTLGRFSENDWTLLRASSEPLMTLSGITNHYSKKADPHLDQAEVARLRDLPLHHGSSLEAALAIAEQGEMLSHREALRRGLIDRSVGNTHPDDQLLGLDTHVFLDFGRPSYLQEGRHDVNIVVSPRAMNVPGSFITPNDYMDYVAAANSSVAEQWLAESNGDSERLQKIEARQAREYLADVAVAPHCYEAIARSFADRGLLVEAFVQGLGDKRLHSVFVGGREAMGFHPPEAKIPKVGLDLVEAFEFREQGALHAFAERFPALAERCRLMPAPRGKIIAQAE